MKLLRLVLQIWKVVDFICISNIFGLHTFRIRLNRTILHQRINFNIDSGAVILSITLSLPDFSTGLCFKVLIRILFYEHRKFLIISIYSLTYVKNSVNCKWVKNKKLKHNKSSLNDQNHWLDSKHKNYNILWRSFLLKHILIFESL